MKRALSFFVGVGAAALAGLATPTHALTPPQLAANAAKVRAEALARARTQAEAKARADVLAQSKADATTKAKAFALARQNVQSETKRRTEAAQKAAQVQMQIRTANLQLQTKTGNGQRLAQTKVQPISKLQIGQAQPLRSAAHPQFAQTVRQRPSTSKSPIGQTSKSAAHAH